MATRSQILKKEQALSGLIEARQSILAEAASLSDEQQNQIFLGIWSVKDVLAHLIGWDYTNLEAVKGVLEGQVPTFYEHHDRDWRTYNAMLVRKHKTDPFQELLDRARASQKKLMEFLQTIPPESFNRDFGVRFRGYKVTIQRLLEAEAKDERIHHEQITDFFRDST
jgi:uncharacterized damage-inducible protein DinB